MIRLVQVELTRLRWRRAVLGLLALCVVLPAAVFIVTVVSTQQQSLDEMSADSQMFIRDDIARCERRPRQYGVYDVQSAPNVAAACEAQVLRNYGNPPLDLVDQRQSGTGPALVALLAILMLLVGTTFVGHDWNTGSMSNQLLFEPRRQRVWAAKAVAVALVAAAVSLVVLVLYWSGLWAVASARDVPIPDHAVAAAYKQVVLGAVLVTAAAVFGYALTMLLRSTVGTIGLLFAVSVLSVVLIGALGLASLEAFMPWSNFAAFVVGGYTFYVDSACFGPTCDPTRTVGRAQGAVYFLVLLAVVVVPSLQTFRTRDLP